MKGTGKKRKINKYELVKEYLLEEKKITSWFAIQNFGATRLADIIWKMRNRGYDIAGEWNYNDDGSRYMIYYLHDNEVIKDER